MSATVAVWVTLALVLAAGGTALYLIISERRRHQDVERENARLLAEGAEREKERNRLADRIITAEQDERRRLALFLHDGPVQNLAGIAIARVNARLEAAERGEINRVDLLARLMEGKDENGEKLGRAELTAEALTQLIAGSDTTSNTSCALLFHMLMHPECVKKLQAELDQALPSDDVPTHEQVKNLPYLDMCIQETLRIHSTSSQGLPRVVPPGPGVEIAGHHFPQGTVLSVPAYTMHHSKEIWGKDADEFRPERWEKVTER